MKSFFLSVSEIILMKSYAGCNSIKKFRCWNKKIEVRITQPHIPQIYLLQQNRKWQKTFLMKKYSNIIYNGKIRKFTQNDVWCTKFINDLYSSEEWKHDEHNDADFTITDTNFCIMISHINNKVFLTIFLIVFLIFLCFQFIFFM